MEAIYILGAIALLVALIYTRKLLIRYAIRSTQRAALYKEYAEILNDPKYRVKNNYE